MYLIFGLCYSSLITYPLHLDFFFKNENRFNMNNIDIMLLLKDEAHLKHTRALLGRELKNNN